MGKNKPKEAKVDKEQVDELYHLLRVASNMKASGMGLTTHEEVDIIYGLTRHLLAGGDYPSLIRFSMYYGRRFLVGPTREAIVKTGWRPSRIVDLGSGLGWLGRGISTEFELIPCLFVDKRPWVFTDLVADLETEQGMAKVFSAMKDRDLIVAADLLHCLDNPKGIMSRFSKWPMAILEYCPTNMEYADSYSTQIKRYGATPIAAEDFVGMFPGRKVDIVDLNPYILLLVEAEKEEGVGR